MWVPSFCRDKALAQQKKDWRHNLSTIDAMIQKALEGSVGKAQKLPNMGTPHVVYKTVAVDDFVLTLQLSCRSRRTGKPIPGINKGHTQGEPSPLRLLVNPTDSEVESVKADQNVAALKVCIPETATLTEIKWILHTRTQGKECLSVPQIVPVGICG